jgi:hypothetical protein
MRRVLFLRSPDTGLGSMPNPFKFPESSYGRGAQAVHLRPVKVIALTRVASLRSQVLDASCTTHPSLTKRSCNRAWSGARHMLGRPPAGAFTPDGEVCSSDAYASTFLVAVAVTDRPLCSSD